MSDFGDFVVGTPPPLAKDAVIDFDSFSRASVSKPIDEVPPMTTDVGNDEAAASNASVLANIKGNVDARNKRLGVTPTEPKNPLTILKDPAGEVASVADLVYNMFPGAAGLGADIGGRAREISRGNSREKQIEAGKLASAETMEALGTDPFKRLLSLAGMGVDEGDSSNVDKIMKKATDLIGKGGEWVEEHTGGLLRKGDVESITNTLMIAGGGKGLEAGVKRLGPQALNEMGGVKLSRQSIERIQAERRQNATPTAVEKEVGAAADARAAAAAESPDAIFDPLRGVAEEPVPEMETGNLTPAEVARGKVRAGDEASLTVEERAAIREERANETMDVRDLSKRLYGKQAGGIDPKLVARMAAIGLGVAAGHHFDDEGSFMGAVVGGIGGAALSHVTPTRAMNALRAVTAPDTRLSAAHLGDRYDKIVETMATNAWGLQRQIEAAVPKENDQIAVTKAFLSGNHAGLSTAQNRALAIAQTYMTNLQNRATATKSWASAQKVLASVGIGPDTPISQYMGAFSNAVVRQMAAKDYTQNLQSMVTPAGVPVVTQAAKAPPGYVAVSHPQVAGLRIHPEIAPYVEMIFDTSDPGVVMKGIQAISDTSKRMAVSFSLFHAKALTDALIAGASNPAKAVAELPRFAAGTSRFLKELERGSASPLVRRAIDGGLKFSLERANPAVEDAGTGFYRTMKGLQDLLDKGVVEGAGLRVKAFVEMNHKVDTFMWARLHAGMKLMVFEEKFNVLMTNSAKAVAKGKAARTLTETEAALDAASYTNDLFGGLNWRMIADHAKTRWGKDLGHFMLKPGMRRINQILLFAPDWTLSTTRAAVKAFSGKPDFLRPTTLAGLHQQYLIRSAIYYALVGEAINLTMSGHHLWENKDPTTIDMDPKGERRMQWSKHTMEPVHWLTKPGQQALNKLGYIPREIANQLAGTEYLSPYVDKRSGERRMGPPMRTSRLVHALKGFTPIALQQGSESSSSGLAGFAGIPIYGKTAEERAKLREERRKERQRQRAKEKQRG